MRALLLLPLTLLACGRGSEGPAEPPQAAQIARASASAVRAKATPLLPRLEKGEADAARDLLARLDRIAPELTVDEQLTLGRAVEAVDREKQPEVAARALLASVRAVVDGHKAR